MSLYVYSSHLTPATILTDVEDPGESVYTQLCPHALHGFDKNGNPIYWESTGIISGRLGQLKQELTLDDLLTRHIRVQVTIKPSVHDHCNLKLTKGANGPSSTFPWESDRSARGKGHHRL